MDKKKDRLQEQDAPLKNTDHAFVRVNKDGTPFIPKSAEKNKAEKKEREKPDKSNRQRS
jgi:hypothetical protein